MALEKTLWTQLQDLVSTGQTASDNFDIAFSNIDTAIDQIDANTANILSAEQNDTILDTRISTLEEIKSNYNYSDVGGVSTTSNVYSTVNNLIVPNAQAGTYQLVISSVFSYSSTSRSSFFRVIQNGGTPLEFRLEPKDNTDNSSKTHVHTFQHAGGDIDVLVEYRTEVNGDVLMVSHHQIILEQKL